jgi:arylsulfatase A-like enzyme
MTGKYPIKTGMQHECIVPTAEWGLRKSEKTLANYLKKGGSYATHIVGKWDLGHYARELWPTNRGFDTFYVSCKITSIKKKLYRRPGLNYSIERRGGRTNAPSPYFSGSYFPPLLSFP